MTPMIGITTYHARADWRGWSEEGALLPWKYVTCIRDNGGSTVLLPPNGDAAEAPAEAENIVSRLDGVVIAGGGDIDPAIYGAAAHPKTDVNAPDRDVWELAVAEAAIKLGVPLLGICRGMQMVNVASGGTLHQHLPDLVGHDHHSGNTEGFGTHRVRVTAGSIVRSILPDGGDYFDVPTHHHQAADKVGDGLIPVAWAGDGIVEAVESDSPENFVVGVQWHPEQGTDPRLFLALIAAGERHSAERSVEPPLFAGA
jgi:putative glutamine amidotransferase